jgi:hypothetical protein
MSLNSAASRYEIISPKKAGSYSIQGAKATDIEWRVAKALDTLDIPYIFQYELFGGHSKRGGVVVDFLAITAPLSTPIWVQGEYWHQSRQKTVDDYQMAIVAHYNRGQLAEAVVLWGAELQTDEAALSTVRRELRI